MTAQQFYERVYGPSVAAIAAIEAAGIKVDVAYGTKLAVELRATCETLAKEAAGIAAGLGVQDFKPTEKDRVREIVYGKLGMPVGRKTDKKQLPSVEAGVLREFKGKHRFIDVMLGHDRYQKALSTSVEKWILPVSEGGWLWPDGKLHSDFHLDVARSGRSSSDNPNIQNIPARDRELAPRIRRMLVPSHPKGELLQLDYMAFELRVSAMYTGDEVFIDVFRRGGNPHREFAAAVLGVLESQVGEQSYAAFKGSNFQLIFGGTWPGLQRTLREIYGIILSDAGAKQIVSGFSRLHPWTMAYIEARKRDVLERGFVESLTGRRRAIAPPVPGTTGYEYNHPFNVAANTPVQGTAFDIMLGATLEYYNKSRRAKLRSRQNNVVHDDGWYDIWPGERGAVLELAHECMTQLGHLFDFLTVPLDTEAKVGRTMGDMEKISRAA